MLHCFGPDPLCLATSSLPGEPWPAKGRGEEGGGTYPSRMFQKSGKATRIPLWSPADRTIPAIANVRSTTSSTAAGTSWSLAAAAITSRSAVTSSTPGFGMALYFLRRPLDSASLLRLDFPGGKDRVDEEGRIGGAGTGPEVAP
jgi:hypothetical protein